MSDEKKKCGCFCKLLWCLAGVVLLALLVVASMPLWISPVATGVANSVVPKVTGTAFHVERIYVNPWTGAVRINDMKLSNPEGFGESPAFSMKSFTLDIALLKLFSNKLHIKELVIEDPFASYYSHEGTNNIDFILANVEKVLGEKKEEDKEEEEEVEEKDEKSQMKIIIDHFRVSGTKVKLMENDMIPPMPIMTIDLTDIGKESDGSSLDDVWQTISGSFMKGMGSVGDGLGALGGMLGDGAKSLTDALGGTGDGAKSAVSAVSDGAKDAASAVSDSAKDAASAVSDGAKAAADAAADTAKKAAEGVKNLFK